MLFDLCLLCSCFFYTWNRFLRVIAQVFTASWHKLEISGGYREIPPGFSQVFALVYLGATGFREEHLPKSYKGKTHEVLSNHMGSCNFLCIPCEHFRPFGYHNWAPWPSVDMRLG